MFVDRAGQHPPSSDTGHPAVPRGHDNGDVMSHDSVITVPRDHDNEPYVSSTLVEIDRRLEVIEAELAQAAPLVIERDRLLRARAALRGEPPPPTLRPAVPRVTQDDVAQIVERRPGSRAGEIAKALGVGQPAISAHLYRGKRNRFECRGGRCFLIQSG